MTGGLSDLKAVLVSYRKYGTLSMSRKGPEVGKGMLDFVEDLS